MFILVLPGLLSTYTLYGMSSRSSFLDFIQGSYSPAMLVNVFFPFIFNLGDRFMGYYASPDYLIQEIYTYIGISTIIISFISYLNLKSEDLAIKRFINILLLFFFLLGLIRYIPLISFINFLPFSLFRYWGRAIVFLNLALSILVGIYLSSSTYIETFYKYFLSIFTFKNRNIKYVLYIISYISLLEIFSIVKLFPLSINISDSSVFNLLAILNRQDYIFEYWYYIWFLVLFTFILILISNIELIKRYRNIFLSITIILDILIFGFIATKDSLIKDSNSLFPSSNLPSYITETVKNKRLLDLTDSIGISNNLIEDYYGINGYSVLYIEPVNKVIKSIGLKSLKHTILEDKYFLNDSFNRSYFYFSIKDLGIEYLIKDLSTSQLVIENVSPYPSYIKSYYRKEGKVLIETSSTEDILLNTYVLKYPGWDIYLNGTRIDIVGDTRLSKNSKVTDLFMNISLPKGNNVLFLEFHPKDLYLGLNISIIMTLILFYISYVVFFSRYKIFKI
jgi:hypothetical protein